MDDPLICGGSWNNPAENCRSEIRVWPDPRPGRTNNSGLRVVKEVEPPDREIRGGRWASNAEYCRSAYRSRFDPSFRSGYGGFRVVKETPNG